MRKITVSDLRTMIKETLNETDKSRSILSESKTAAEYNSDSRDIFLEVTGKLMNWSAFWEGSGFFSMSRYPGIDKTARQQARFDLDNTVSYSDLSSSVLRFALTMGAVLSDYHDGSPGSDVIEELERDGIIDGSFRAQGSRMTFSLSALNAWLDQSGA